MIIRVKNLLDESAPRSYLSVGETAGGTTLRVKNINNFTLSHAVQIGETGQEQSEILLLSTGTPSGTAINTTATTRFDHAQDVPVYDIKYDKIIFKKSTSGTSGTATAIAGGTVNITPDEEFTQYDDSSGAVTHAYKVAFYNSVTEETSSDSDWLTSSGFSFYSLARIRERVKRKLFSANFITDDTVIDDWINEWVEDLNNEAIHVNKDYGLGTTNVAFGTNGLGTITASDFKEIRRIWVTYNGVDNYTATRMNITDFTDSDDFNTTHPYFYYQGDNVIGIKPEESGGTASLIYYTLRTQLTDDGDELPVVMRPYTNSFVDYCTAQAYYKDEKEKMGDRYQQRADIAKTRFVAQITPRQKTGVNYIGVEAPLSGQDYDVEISY